MQTYQKSKDILLIPAKDLEATVKKVFQTSKRESDDQLAAFQRSNKAKREAKNQR